MILHDALCRPVLTNITILVCRTRYRTKLAGSYGSARYTVPIRPNLADKIVFALRRSPVAVLEIQLDGPRVGGSFVSVVSVCPLIQWSPMSSQIGPTLSHVPASFPTFYPAPRKGSTFLGYGPPSSLLYNVRRFWKYNFYQHLTTSKFYSINVLP